MTPLPSPARDLSERLAARALAVCRAYLPNGRRHGRYWNVGDVADSRGRSLYVRLVGPPRGPGAAGRWTDAATGQHGDLLDLIQARLALPTLTATLAEARSFLGADAPRAAAQEPHSPSTSEAARRLFARADPIAGTPAERYLRARAITAPLDGAALRYHPGLRCRELGHQATLPALVAAITDTDGRVHAVQRTWLDPHETVKARLRTPRRSLGNQLGHGVRLGRVGDVLLAGEGLETVLSLKSALPALPMVAGLSAVHLGALALGPGVRRLYIARDRDPAGAAAAARLRERAAAQGIAVVDLVPRADDFNADLRRFGVTALRARVLAGLAPEDAGRFGPVPPGGRG